MIEINEFYPKFWWYLESTICANRRTSWNSRKHNFASKFQQKRASDEATNDFHLRLKIVLSSPTSARNYQKVLIDVQKQETLPHDTRARRRKLKTIALSHWRQRALKKHWKCHPGIPYKHPSGRQTLPCIWLRNLRC